MNQDLPDFNNFWYLLNSAVVGPLRHLTNPAAERYRDLLVTPDQAKARLELTPEGQARIVQVERQYAALARELKQLQQPPEPLPQLEVYRELDIKRWKLLGPQLYTLCSLPPSTRPEDIEYQSDLMKARVKDLQQLYPKTNCTEETLIQACGLKSVAVKGTQAGGQTALQQMTERAKTFMSDSTKCGKTKHDRFALSTAPRSERSLHVRLTGDNLRYQTDPAANMYSDRGLRGMRYPDGCTADLVGSANLQELIDVQSRQGNFTLRVENFVTRKEDSTLDMITGHQLVVAKSGGQLVGIMVIKFSEEEGYGGYLVIKNIDIPTVENSACGSSKEKVFAIMLSALLRALDNPYLRDACSMVVAIVPKEQASARMFLNLGFTSFALEVNNEGDETDFFLDIGMTKNLGVDFFRLLKHTLMLGNPLQLWLLLSEVAPSLRRDKIAWNCPLLYWGMVVLLAGLPEKRSSVSRPFSDDMLRVLAFFLHMGKNTPYFDIVESLTVTDPSIAQATMSAQQQQQLSERRDRERRDRERIEFLNRRREREPEENPQLRNVRQRLERDIIEISDDEQGGRQVIEISDEEQGGRDVFEMSDDEDVYRNMPLRRPQATATVPASVIAAAAAEAAAALNAAAMNAAEAATADTSPQQVRRPAQQQQQQQDELSTAEYLKMLEQWDQMPKLRQ